MSVIETACRVAHYLIMGYGVWVCWIAYQHSRKRAWLFLCVFCLSTFLLLGMRQLGKAIHGSDPKSSQALVVGEGDQGLSVQRKATVSLPIFPLLLVIGLSSLAADEKKRAIPDSSASDEGAVLDHSPPVARPGENG